MVGCAVILATRVEACLIAHISVADRIGPDSVQGVNMSTSSVVGQEKVQPKRGQEAFDHHLLILLQEAIADIRRSVADGLRQRVQGEAGHRACSLQE
ncbi:hypothetical protein D9M72_631640 [compost metagenome]